MGKHNYFVSYNVFKNNKRICSGDMLVNSNKQLINCEDYENLRNKITDNLMETIPQLTFVQLISINYLGKED